MEIRFTLLPDGSSDRALMPILRWTLSQHVDSRFVVDGDWADLGRLRRPPKKLHDRIDAAIDLYPCKLLFVHRDAENDEPRSRFEEIAQASKRARLSGDSTLVPVVPVRMTEAWLLFDESAIRRASNNRNGTDALDIPDLRRVESIPDPKAMLFDALRRASGLSGRKLHNLNLKHARALIADHIDDFSPLRTLSAFRRFEDEVTRVCQERGWAAP